MLLRHLISYILSLHLILFNANNVISQYCLQHITSDVCNIERKPYNELRLLDFQLPDHPVVYLRDTLDKSLFTYDDVRK